MKTESSTTTQSSHSSDDPELIATELTFKKIARESIKVGYRDGADEAKQQSFQEYFDKGFEQGFLNGYSIGALKAKQRLGCNESVDASVKSKLNTSRQGMCIICKETKITEASIEDIVQKQRRVITDFVAQNVSLK